MSCFHLGDNIKNTSPQRCRFFKFSNVAVLQSEANCFFIRCVHSDSDKLVVVFKPEIIAEIESTGKGALKLF